MLTSHISQYEVDIRICLEADYKEQTKKLRQPLNDELLTNLKQLKSEILAAVEAIATTNDYDLVFAYPDAPTAKEIESPAYFDLKLHPPAAMPFSVSASSDITAELITTLNTNNPQPAAKPTADPVP